MIDFYRVKCTRIKDGDTFVGDISFGVFGMVLPNQVFRLNGIDTPELNKHEINSFEATQFTAQHIQGKNIIVFIHKKDAFGRWLVDVHIDGNIQENFNDLLLKEGLATIWKKK